MFVIFKMDMRGNWIEMGVWNYDPRPYLIETLNERYMIVENSK